MPRLLHRRLAAEPKATILRRNARCFPPLAMLGINPSQMKRRLAHAQDATGINRALLHLQRLAFFPFVRAVKYHAASPSHMSNFERQVAFYAENFVSVDLPALLDLHRGIWPHPKPGLIVAFDDGLREPYDNALPILEKYGFAAWFFVPVAFIDAVPAEQRGFAASHDIFMPDASDDWRIALSWDEIRDIEKRGHVVGCHTSSHHRLVASSRPELLRHEIVDAKAVMEERLGHEVSVFCWVGGEEPTFSAEAALLIREAGYRVSFMNNNFVIRPGCNLLQLQSTNLEVDYPMDLVRFQLSGFLDAMTTPKRRRVVKLTG